MMKRILSIFVFIAAITACSIQKQEIQGDLYFKLIDFGSFYGADDSTIAKFEKSLESIRSNKNASIDDLELISFIDLLKKNKLLYAPWINVKTQSEIVKVFLTEKEYKKLEKFDLNQLEENNKKVELKLLVKKLDDKVYFSDEIAEFKEFDGETYWRK